MENIVRKARESYDEACEIQTQGEIQSEDSISQVGSRAPKTSRVSSTTNSQAKAAVKRAALIMKLKMQDQVSQKKLEI